MASIINNGLMAIVMKITIAIMAIINNNNAAIIMMAYLVIIMWCSIKLMAIMAIIIIMAY